MDLSRVERPFDRTLLYGYELSPPFPPQTLIIVAYERDTLGNWYDDDDNDDDDTNFELIAFNFSENIRSVKSGSFTILYIEGTHFFLPLLNVGISGVF